MELEVDHWSNQIKLSYGKFEYKIVDGKKIKESKESAGDGSEESLLMKQVNKTLSIIENHTTYQEVDNDYFNRQLDDEWDWFMEYFKAPKCIRKNEYRV